MWTFLVDNAGLLLQKTGEHFLISAIALGLGAAVAIPLGMFLTQFRRFSGPIIGFASILQTIPSLALLALMIPLFGVGRVPAIVALFIYSLLPILRNTFLGLNSVPPNIVDAARGMGLTRHQRMVRVRLPLAAPVIMSGVRLSGIYVIAWAALASYIGAGGLGDFIFTGLNVYNKNMIILGTIPVTLLALLADVLLGLLEKTVTPRTRSRVEKEAAS